MMEKKWESKHENQTFQPSPLHFTSHTSEQLLGPAASREQCSKISWFITNSAILGLASVKEISPPWEVTRALKFRDFGQFPKY